MYSVMRIYALVAQLDRAFGYEPRGRGFESLRAYHLQKTTVFDRELSIFIIKKYFERICKPQSYYK